MDPVPTGAFDLALETPQQFESTLHGTTKLTDAVKEAWQSRCSMLGEEERKKFESLACDSLADYVEKLEVACEKYREESFGYKVIDWFEPIFKAVELLTPAAAVAIQAYPNPGSLVLGGIVGVLEITKRLIIYQKLTVQMLAKMGRKARILLEYERDIYKDDDLVQKALIQVYGDIIAFCQKAFRFLTKNGQLRVKVHGFSLILFRDYKSRLREKVQDFENHMENLEDKASLCDKRRLKELRDNYDARLKEFGQVVAVHFHHHDDFLVKWSKREEHHREREEEKRRLLGWLSSLSFRTAYHERRDKHLEGTGSWFLGSDIYRAWKFGTDSDFLWVSGKPGCGKSFLAAVAVTDLELEVGPDVALAYAFCRREEESSRHPSAIFGALAEQICRQQSGINLVLNSEFSESHKGELPSLRTIRSVMKSALSHFSRTFLVIDGMDECESNDQLRKQFAKELLDLMQDDLGTRVKILVFSRHDFDLEKCFKPYKQVQPDLGANDEDLKAYIDSLFPNDSQANVNHEIREQCIEKADGMFLWVKLLAQTLDKPLNSKQKLKRVKEIPPGLKGIYDRILDDIYKQDEDVRTTAFLVLIWITHAQRPLNRSEMLEAVADYDDATGVEEAFKNTNAEHLVAICANLVFIDKDGYFRLCHESVRGYFDESWYEITQGLAEYQQRKLNAHGRLAEICLTYLLLENFECGPAKSLGKLKALVKKFPFLEYAAHSWGFHVTQAIRPSLRGLVQKLIDSPARRELSMQICLYDPADGPDIWKYPGTSNPLHILSIFGLRQIAETLPDVLMLSQEADGSGSTPLSLRPLISPAPGFRHYITITTTNFGIKYLNNHHSNCH